MGNLGPIVKDHSLNTLPAHFSNCFTDIKDIHNYSTRAASNNLYATTASNTNYYLYSVKNQSVHGLEQPPQLD